MCATSDWNSISCLQSLRVLLALPAYMSLSPSLRRECCLETEGFFCISGFWLTPSLLLFLAFFPSVSESPGGAQPVGLSVLLLLIIEAGPLISPFSLSPDPCHALVPLSPLFSQKLGIEGLHGPYGLKMNVVLLLLGKARLFQGHLMATEL